MTEGLERRPQIQDNLRGASAIEPVTAQPVAIPRPKVPKIPNNSYSAEIANSLNQFVGGRLQQIQKKRQEQSVLDGQLAAMQGQSLDQVKMDGDKWAMEGWRVVTAQSLSSSLLRAQEAEISRGAYEQNPEIYRERLVQRIEAMTSDIEDERTRELATENLMKQMPVLVDQHIKQNLAFKEQQNFDTLAQSVDVLSRDNTSTGDLIAFASGKSEATASLSEARRKEAVTQGIVNAFTNNNPAAYAHLDDAGFISTENLTSTQISKIRTAQRKYEARFKEEFNADHHKEVQRINEQAAAGDLSPLEAVEQLAAANAKYGLRTGAAQGGQIYDRARLGVQFDQGTRGLNIAAAGVNGDYGLQAELMQNAVEQQESGGRANAVSNKGATGVMQLMPGTAMDPGYQVRNIFQHADSLGVSYSGRTREEAARLMRNPDVNRQMGTEYLEAMLREFNGDVNRALVAYNAGPAIAEQWDGNIDSLNPETKNYVISLNKAWNNDIPDPEAERVAAERNLQQAYNQAGIRALERSGPERAENDELFMQGEIPVETWVQNRQAIYDEYGLELTKNRISQEQAMMRSVVGSRIKELQEQGNVQTAVELQSTLEAAEVQYEQNLRTFEQGNSGLSLDEINQGYMQQVLDAYNSTGTTMNASEISSRAASAVRQSSEAAQNALRGEEDNALISQARRAGNISDLSPRLQDKALKQFDAELEQRVQNYRAENPDASPVAVEMVRRQARIDFVARQGIVDDQVQKWINQVASGKSWVDKNGEPNPTTVAGLQAYLAIAQADTGLAHQYVPDAEAKGRITAAAAMVQTQLPDRQVWMDADLSNKQDPGTQILFDAVQQVGLSIGTATPEETERRVLQMRRKLRHVNVSRQMIPNSLLSGMQREFEAADVNAARGLDEDVINSDYIAYAERFIEDVVPYMPATSQENAMRITREYLDSRGAIMGNSFVMPGVSDASIRAQMFPGQDVQSTAAVNTAVVNWMNSTEAAEKSAIIREWQNSFSLAINRRPDFSVTFINNKFVASVSGYGNVVLPIREIGDMYVQNR